MMPSPQLARLCVDMTLAMIQLTAVAYRLPTRVILCHEHSEL
jgi:hypothetical protein